MFDMNTHTRVHIHTYTHPHKNACMHTQKVTAGDFDSKS